MDDLIRLLSQTARKDLLGGILIAFSAFVAVGLVVYGVGSFTAATGDITQWTPGSRAAAGIIITIAGFLAALAGVATFADHFSTRDTKTRELLNEYRDILTARVPPKVGESARTRRLRLNRGKK